MELKIHKSLFNGQTLAQLIPSELLSIEGWKLAGDMSFDGDDYYYFIFERDIDPNECFDTMEDQHVWPGMPSGGDKCKCGKKVWQVNYIENPLLEAVISPKVIIESFEK